jgi:photosystem II stability/assembly factor-like uncharacterized protein
MNGVRRFSLILIALICVTSAVAQIPGNTYQEMRWRMIGPFRGGRTRAVAGVASQPNVFYMGQVNGGVWKTTDSGRTWFPIFDNQPTQSIGDIAVAESDPNIIYVASGEGLRRPDLAIGDGIYKSTDAGRTWTHLGLRDGQAIPAIRIDPKDPNRLFAAVLGHPYGPNKERGIYRSTDGGQTWQNVLFKDENTGGCDVEIDPANPNVIYAGMWESRQGPWEDANEYGGSTGGLFKSTDGGNTWKQLTQGLPPNQVQINVAIAPSQPNRLYASLSTTEKHEYGTGKGVGFYRSDDGGESWVKITEDPRPAEKIGGGDLAVPVVDPKNADVVYSASIVAHKSVDGGKTWRSWRGAPGGDDYQNLWINPDNPNIILLVADQGALVTENGGETWSSWFNQPTAQLYHVVADNHFPYRVCSGQQESGSVCISSRGNDGEITERDWHPVGVIEYGYAAPDPLNDNIVYGAGRTEVSKYHWDTGQIQNITPIPVKGDYRAERTEPIVFSPVDPHTLYYAANVVFKTTDGGEHWTTISPDLGRPNQGVPATVESMIKGNATGGGFVPPGSKPTTAKQQRGAVYALAPSFKNVNTIWAGTDDGAVWITRDGGKNWTNITPQEVGGWNKVTQIEASHFDDNTAYISVSRFRIDDLRPLIFRTHDGGKTWQQIATGITESEPVDTVREDPVRKGLLFAGTEKSVWVSFDDGDHWQSLQLNLPHTSMRDLWIKDSDLIVATHGRGFWILDDVSPLRQITADIAKAPSHLFTPAPAWRVMRSTWPDTPIPPDEPTAQNPPDGAVIDYYLGSAATSEVAIEILDSAGHVARRFSSDDKPPLTQEEIEKQLIPPYWLRAFEKPETAAGMHRFVWDLHYTAPLSATHEYPIMAVPHDTPRRPEGVRALPGQYTVRLMTGGKSVTAPLTVKMDPRVRVSQADLQRQFELMTRLSSLLSESSKAVMQAKSVEEQLEKAQASDAAKALQKKISELLEGGEATPGLSDTNDNIYALYSTIGQVDAAPTPAQVNAVDKEAQAVPSLLQRWQAILKTDLPAVNQQLKNGNQPGVNPDLEPSHEGPGMDQDEG